MESMQQEAGRQKPPLPGCRGRASKDRRDVEGAIKKERTKSSSVVETGLLEEVLKRENLFKALKQVVRNKGAPGIDGILVSELDSYLRVNWKRIREEILTGKYFPKPVKRCEIPKYPKGKRMLGIPTVVDRFIQQAVNQVMQPIFDPHFSEHSYGFREGRSAHDAIRRAQEYIAKGRPWVVDIDVEKFFDRVNHDVLMSLVRRRIKDKRILILIRRYLQSGIMDQGIFYKSPEGTPQGGPLSPLLSNIMLDVLDKDLENRGHKFCRYADDCNVYMKSRRAGNRVMASLKRFLAERLKLKVNEEKSQVDLGWKRKFLGFTFSRGYMGKIRRKVAPVSIDRFKNRVRDITQRSCGRSLPATIERLNEYLKGWKGYFRLTEVPSTFKELDKWIRRRLRAGIWKQWKRRGYKELRNRGVSRVLAWNTAKSAHGPWRLSNSPGVSIGLPVTYFSELGLLQLGT